MNIPRIIQLIVILALFLSPAYGQFRSAGILAGFGGTIVDVAEAAEWDDLEEWDNWAVMAKATGEYGFRAGLSLGAEFGWTRLYYWEYRWSDGYYSGYRFGTESTVNIGLHVVKYLGEKLYLKGGAGAHFFLSGGTVAGLLAAAGYDFHISDNLCIPLELRIEPVFGNATPIPVMLGTGIKYKL